MLIGDAMKRILLDAGHGGTDSGAQADGTREADVALEITLAAGTKLEHLRPNDDICYTRIADKAKSLGLRYSAIVDLRPNAFVSIHCNAVIDDPTTAYDERELVDGFEIFYRDEFDLSLAKAIFRLMARSKLWRRSRGIKQDQEWLHKKLTVLNNLEVPAVLVEVGFLSNTNERKMLLNNVSGIGDLIAHGINEFLEDQENDCA